MTDIPIPGFKAYLQRHFGNEVQEEIKAKPMPKIDIVGKVEERTIIEIRGSSNIAVLDYNRKLKRLTTTFTSGAVHAYGDITPAEFERVAYPGEEFNYSVGKAHYALIRSKKS